MREKVLPCFLGLALGAATFAAEAFTTGDVPADGVYKFTFGVSEAQDGSIPVSADAVCDVKGTGYYDGSDSATFSYGFLGTTDTSYIDDAPTGTKVTDANMIDGFTVVKGQKIVLRNTEDKNGLSCVAGPFAKDYLPAGASSYEGRYPVRFTMRAEERAYYAVTCTVANASADANADVTLYAERSRIIAHHMTLNPGETRTFAWSVELAPQYCKIPADYYKDDAVNVAVVGENAALASLTVVKQPQKAGKVRGNDVANMNDGKTMWICTDSTGCDYGIATPFFSLVNYAGVGAAVARWMPADIAIVNQGERGLSTANGVHRAACLLKPGDYLYVEYGHNDNSVESYTNNLEAYLSDATAAGANLIIVSPIERHNTWDSENLVWKRSLQGYAEAGEAWVKAKIDEGSRNVAFVDLNKPYAEWMNTETDRICEKNSSIARNAAINFYYRSAKGSAVDATHENTAGADHAAYIFWQNALERVAAGEGAEEGSYEKVQADVLKGITDGYKAKLGIDSDEDNTPWNVSDEIIAAGGAPNSFWDETVKAGFDFANDVAVANVAATVDQEGVVTISGATLRVLNSGVYYKAVVDIVGADGTVTNRYWSFSNYDTTGCEGGTTVNPEKPGFISADLASGAEPGDAFSEILSVPAGGKAYLWFAKADESTWQVGGNGPSSAIYPLEAWTDVLVDDDCASTSAWNNFTRAVTTFEVPDGEDYIAFTSTARDSSGYHKVGVFYLTLPEGKEFSDGRVRVSFKALYNGGDLRFVLADSLGNSANTDDNEKIVPNSLKMLTLNSTKATVLGSSAVEITMSADETPVAQNDINGDSWLDVDMILNLDTRKALASVGGSEYRECTIPDAGTPFKYFGIQPITYSTHDGAIDDVKIMTLAPSPKHLVEAVPSNDACGHVEINGSEVTSLNAVEGADVVLKAVSADVELYKFVEWQDAEGNTVSTKQTLVIEDVAADCAYTAVFREYGHNENRVATWDFSAYKGDFAVIPTAATIVTDNGMKFSLQDGDSMTADGLVWHNSALGHKGWQTAESLSETADNYIIYTPSASGTFTLKFSVDNYNANRKPTMFIKAAGSFGECTKTPEEPYTSVVVGAANTKYTLSAELDAGVTYYIWTYSNNWAGGDYAHNYTISSIAYSYAPVYITATAAVNNANYGSAVVDGAAAAEVFSGHEVTFVATPASSAYRFVNWTDGEENIVSTEATFTVPVSADVAYTANFEKVAAGDAVELNYDFVPFAGSAASCTGVSTFDYGCFKFQMISGDSVGASGATWYKVAVDDKSALGTALSETGDHYIKFTAPYDGTVSFKTSVDSLSSKYKAALYIKAAEAASACANSGDAKVNFTEANKVYTLSLDVTAGTTYYVWAYSWNAGAGGYNPYITISSIIYSHASDLTTLTVANSDSTAGAVTVNGAAVDGEFDVQKGEYVHLVATPSGANAFAGWKNGDGETVSGASDFWLCVEGATSLTATWRSVDPHSFVWNWKVEEGDWNNQANWLYEGVVPATTYPNDSESDYVTFNTAAKINLGEGASAKEVWLNGAVTFTNGTLTASLVTRYEDDGRAILANAGFANPKNLAAEISCPIVMTAGTINWFNKVSDGDWKDWMTVSGDISGEGRYNVNLANVQGNGVKFTGNNNGFHGDVYTSGGKSNRSVINWSENAVGTNTFLHIGHSYGTYNNDSYRMGADVKFGGVDGGWWDRYDGALLTIGYLNRDSVINISNGVGGRANSVAKVGNANLTLGTKTIKDLTISAGSVTMPVGIAPQTLTVADGTRIIIPGDTAWTDGTVTNLFSYTTLAGAGTLAEQVEVTGLAEGLVATIAVAENTVTATIEAAEVAPTTDDENATITKNGDGSYTVEVTAETVAITVPDGETVREVVVSPDTATVTGVPENATVKVAVSWDGGNAEYAIVSVDSTTGAVSLDEKASVTVDGEKIPLKPTPSDAGDEVAPLEVGEGVSVGIKSIPGLVYRLARGTTPDGIDTAAAKAVAKETATSSRVSLQDSQLPSNAAFYRVTVDLK